jgi:CHAT domain-containing protein
MSQSIIALAGLNRTLSDSTFDANERYDGLLSARELSTLDLSRCGLFTISACQTALGSISSDGVFGLQRGLKNAGVGAMLLSLWNVQTDATAHLMTEFYRRLNQGIPLRQAFKEARKYLMEEQPQKLPIRYEFDPAIMADAPIQRLSPVYHEPQYVNAFILIDALE